MTPWKVAQRLQARKRRCTDGCPGWAIFNEEEGRPVIQACDDCNRLNARWPVTDSEVRTLHVARVAWFEARARVQARRDARRREKRLGDRDRLASLRERKARERKEEHDRVVNEIEVTRYSASVVLDAILEERPDREDIVAALGGLYRFLALALADYKIKFPRARGDSLWVYRNQHSGVGDLHCRFCGGYLESVEMGRHIHDDVKGHTARCALMSLSGLLKPVAPGCSPAPEVEAVPF